MVKVRQVFFVQPPQLFFHIHIAIEVDIAIGRMIVFSVEIKELLVRQLRDHLRVSPRFICIGRIRKQGIQYYTVQDSLRGGERSLHLIVNYTADFQISLRVVQLIAPPLLAECLVALINIRIEHRVHVHMHQILEVLIITARHRIYGLIRVGHGI